MVPAVGSMTARIAAQGGDTLPPPPRRRRRSTQPPGVAYARRCVFQFHGSDPCPAPCCAVLCCAVPPTDFGYDAALPAPTGAGENWGPAPGTDAFGAAPGFEAATGEFRIWGKNFGGGGSAGVGCSNW